MLRCIRIQNHALIHEVEMILDEGFHVFTGETGSGKSILLGAIGLLLGDRADTTTVGLHGDRAIVEGEFVAPQLKSWLTLSDLPPTRAVSVRREVLRNGRSRVFINDAQATVGQLKELGSQLVHIHRQDDLGASLERPALTRVLDIAGNHNSIRESYQEAFQAWCKAKEELQELDSLMRAPAGDVDYLNHQIRELQSLRTHEVNWLNLQAELHSLQHASQLHDALQAAAHACDADESGALVNLGKARRLLANVEGVDVDVDDAQTRLESVHIELSDLSNTLHQLMDAKQPDPTKLKGLEERHDNLMRAMKKHQVNSPEELTKLLQQLMNQVDSLQGLEASHKQALQKESTLKNDLQLAGAALTNQRRKAGTKLIAKVLPLLAQLKMPHAEMALKLQECEPDLLGADEPEIWFTSNPGSPLMPLNKVASGGERARFMLALKSILAGIQSTPVVVLDEIDTGVSGEVATHMGRAMRSISNAPHTRQVLAVTHLPQVAAQAQHHWEVSKTTDGASTHVFVDALEFDKRQLSVATMLSGDGVTDEAMGQAAKLISASS